MSVTTSVPPTPARENRVVDRLPTELSSIVQVKETETETWKEVVRVTTVSRNGAGFSLTKPVVVGRLVSLVLPLERGLRAYDEDAEYYPVLGLVQYCNEGLVDGVPVFHVGVGFIGKKMPESFRSDPLQNYRIVGMRKDGLWEVTEAESQFKNRKQPRYWVSIPAVVTLIQRSDVDRTREETSTQNIGSGGVSVTCSLDAQVGEKVKFACKELDFYSIAIVRNRKAPKDPKGGPQTLHLQFIDTEFPVEKIIAARTLPMTSDGG